jgi:N-formylglutamate amidohydrolase
VANSDLRREEAERGPGGRVKERGNHCEFPVRQAQAELTVAKALAEVLRRRWNGEATTRGNGSVAARA